MATNPKIPRQDRRVGDYAHIDPEADTKPLSWWPMFIIVVAAAILVALIVWLPRVSKLTAPPAAAKVAVQSTANQVQLTGMQMSTPTPGGAMNITGQLYNNGNTSINAVLAQATFLNINGQQLETVNAPLLSLRPDGTTHPLIDNPVKPGATRAFEIRIERLPEGWNRSLPAIRLTEVAANAASGSVPAGSTR